MNRININLPFLIFYPGYTELTYNFKENPKSVSMHTLYKSSYHNETLSAYKKDLNQRSFYLFIELNHRSAEEVPKN